MPRMYKRGSMSFLYSRPGRVTLQRIMLKNAGMGAAEPGHVIDRPAIYPIEQRKRRKYTE